MNSLMVRLVNKIVRIFLRDYHVAPIGYCPSWRKLNIYDDPDFKVVSCDKNVRDNSLLEVDRLYEIYQALRWVTKEKQNNYFSMEVGVYKGGGSYFIAECLTRFSNNFNGHYSVDTFEGHKAADLPDNIEGGHSVSMFSDTAFSKVKNLLVEFKTSTVLASRIQDAEIDYSSLGFVHLDTDLYGPTKYVIEKMMGEGKAPYIIMVDDYGFGTCPGVKKAVDECLEGKRGRMFHAALTTGQYVIAVTE